MQALGVAAGSGQRIYTITREVYAAHPAIVGTALSAHSADTRARVQAALNAGHEVTIHERPVSISGWSGAGYTVIDPSTGAGGYLIEGGGNGGALFLLIATFVFAIASLAILAWLGPFAILGYGWMLMASMASAGAYLDAIGAQVNWSAVSNWVSLTLAIIAVAAIIPALSVVLVGGAAIFAAIFGLVTAIFSVVS